MNRRNWTRIAVFGAIALVVFLIGMTLLPFVFGVYGGWGMMGPGMMGRGWSEGWCPFCGGTGRYQGGFLGGIFAWPIMLMTILLPLGLLALLILGIVWLVRAIGLPPSGAPPSARTCPKCARPVDVDWRVCPFCEEDLQRLQ